MTQRLPLNDVFKVYAGQFVAVDRSTGDVMAVHESPYGLTALLRERGIKGVVVLRAPSAGQPELVGLG